MTRLRYWIIGILVWFFFLYNLELLGGQISLAPFVYAYTAICIILIIFNPQVQRIPVIVQLLIALIPFFVLKVFVGSEIGGDNLIVTLAEVSAIAVTILLGSQVGKILEKFRLSAINLTMSQLYKDSKAFEQGQAQINREILRARRYQRPVSLLSIAINEESLQQSEDQFIQEVQRDVVKRYVNARLAKLLIEELHDIDVVTRRDDHFVMLLPETDRTGLDILARRLENSVSTKLGVKIKIGAASFPDQAVTFESLLEQAESEMMTSETVNLATTQPTEISVTKDTNQMTSSVEI